MIAALFAYLFGCAHQRTTFPMTARGSRRTSVSCLDCGKEFSYDWQAMRIDATIDPLPSHPPVVSEERGA